MKPISLAENPLLGKAETFGDRTTAGIFCRTGDLDFIQLMHLERMPHQSPTSLCHNAFSLHRGVDPIAQFDFAAPPVQAIVQDSYQSVLVPDPHVIALAIGKSEQSLLHEGSEGLKGLRICSDSYPLMQLLCITLNLSHI